MGHPERQMAQLKLAAGQEDGIEERSLVGAKNAPLSG